jgi:WD40-like Beta Propeller Repeat
MKREWFQFVLLTSVLVIGRVATAKAEQDHLPRMPGATLLVGWPPSALWLTRGDQTLRLQSERWGDGNVTPDMSADGRIVVSGRYLGTDLQGFAAIPRRWGTQPPIILAIWSAVGKRWTDFPDFKLGFGGIGLAISPDGTQLAMNRDHAIQMFALRQGKVVSIRKLPNNVACFSWSPDGQQIAFEQLTPLVLNGLPVSLSSIWVLDLLSGAVKQIGEGEAPSWAPSGKWIAFWEYSSIRANSRRRDTSVIANRLALIHPDGTGKKVISIAMGPATPIWSPDSRQMLVQWLRDEEGHVDVDMVDASTGRKKKAFRRVVPIFAWSAQK